MRHFKVGKIVLKATLLVTSLLLLPSCSWSSSDHWTGSDHVRWRFTILDAGGGDRFDWQGNKWQIELASMPADAGVVVRKLDPGDLWGLREGDMVISLANKPTGTVRELLGDLHALQGADAVASVKRGDTEMKVTLRGADYLTVLPSPIDRNATSEAGERGSSGSHSLSVSVK